MHMPLYFIYLFYSRLVPTSRANGTTTSNASQIGKPRPFVTHIIELNIRMLPYDFET